MSASVNFPFDTEAQVCSSIYFAFIIDHPFWFGQSQIIPASLLTPTNVDSLSLQSENCIHWPAMFMPPRQNPLWGLLRETPNTDIGGEWMHFYYRPQRSWVKVTFLQASVILSTGGVSGRGTPLPWQGDPPAGRHPPGSRHPPPRSRPPWDQLPPGADPLWDQPPPRDQTPPVKQTPVYGQRAAGTHPTGMHSCFLLFLLETPPVLSWYRWSIEVNEGRWSVNFHWKALAPKR